MLPSDPKLTNTSLPKPAWLVNQILRSLAEIHFVLSGGSGAKHRGPSLPLCVNDCPCPTANAVPTAEGALQLAMESTDRTLHDSRCLIIGYGRIGRLLADRLLALGAEVTVSARKYGDLAWIEAWGCYSLRTGALTGQLDRFDLIFNTAPALILDGPRLRETREDCVIIDLASAPGGVDQEEARRLSRKVILAPGLPGKAAPRTAAAAIRDSVYHILEERGELM